MNNLNPDGTTRYAEILWALGSLMNGDALSLEDTAFLQAAADNRQLHPDELNAFEEYNGIDLEDRAAQADWELGPGYSDPTEPPADNAWPEIDLEAERQAEREVFPHEAPDND